MSIVTYAPSAVFSPSYRQFQNEVSQLFRAADKVAEPSAWTPAVDIREYQNRFVLRADLPGVALNDLNISVEKNLLTVAGNRADVADNEEDQGQASRTERGTGSFSRQFRLPETVDVNAVSAKGSNGVIEITVPKAATLQPRVIEVQSAD